MTSTDFEGLLRRLLEGRVLIDLKRAAGRPKDHEILAELEAIREERRGR